jgi:hypothetical protein
MKTKSLGMQVGFLFATLGLASCTIQPRDRGVVVATGISTTYRASEESRTAAGIDSWRVTLMSDDSKQVEAFDEDGVTVGRLALAWSTEASSVEMQLPSQGHLSVSSSGEVLAEQLGDPSLLLLFKRDAEEQLEAMGFRQTMACMQAIKKSAELCKKAALTKKPQDILACSAAVAAVVVACAGDLMGGMSGGGMSGGSMSGGGMSGGSMSGGSDTDGNSDTENSGETEGNGETEGGTSNGGTSNGGTSNGGTSNDGTSNGGTSNGGTSDGGTSYGGTSNGGTSYGGTSYGGTSYGGGTGG